MYLALSPSTINHAFTKQHIKRSQYALSPSANWPDWDQTSFWDVKCQGEICSCNIWSGGHMPISVISQLLLNQFWPIFDGIGFCGHLYQVTFVQATFVLVLFYHISNISTGPNFYQTLWTQFCGGQNIFGQPKPNSWIQLRHNLGSWNLVCSLNSQK